MIERRRVVNPPAELSEKAYIGSLEEYREIYLSSIDDPEAC